MSPIDEATIQAAGRVTINGATEDLRRNRPRYTELLVTLMAHQLRMERSFETAPARIEFGGRLHTLQVGDVEQAVFALLDMRARLDALAEGAA